MEGGRRKRRRRDPFSQSFVDRVIKTKIACKLNAKQIRTIIRQLTGDSTLNKLVCKELDSNGYHGYRLHGCITCDNFIWMEGENIPCPNCHNQDGRYNSDGPAQEVFYFPLLPRLKQMYRDEEWRICLSYPDDRPQRRRNRSDIFDGTVYKRLRALVGDCDHFITLGYCADAIASNKRMSRSVLPGILTVLNYDPRVRHVSSNMILTFLLPPKLSTKSAIKFYQLLEDELNELFYTGIAEGKLKGALLMTRADQKGKEFDLGLRACTSYDAPCSVCEIMADTGIGPFNNPHVLGYRMYLPPDHPYRRDPRFGDPELRQPPAYRTKERSETGLEIIRDEDYELSYYQVNNSDTRMHYSTSNTHTHTYRDTRITLYFPV